MPAILVLTKAALALNLPALSCFRTRSIAPTPVPCKVIDEVFQLFFDLRSLRPSHRVSHPLSTIARQGRSVAGVGVPAEDDDLSALLDMVVAAIPIAGVIRMHRCRRRRNTSTPPTISAASPLDVWCAAPLRTGEAWHVSCGMR